MKNKLLLISSLFIFCTSLFGQSETEKDNTTFISSLLNIDTENFTVSQTLSSFSEITMTSSTNSTTYTLPRKKISIGFSLQKLNSNNTFYEVSLTRLIFSKSDEITFNTIFDGQNTNDEITTGGNFKLLDINTRLEFGKYFYTHNSNKINIGVAIAAEPSFIFSNIDPKISNAFPIKSFRARLHLTLIPVASYNITDNFALALKFAPNVFNLDWNWTRTENPILTFRQRIDNDFSSSFFNDNVAFNLIAKFKIHSKEETKRSKYKSKKKKKKRGKKKRRRR